MYGKAWQIERDFSYYPAFHDRDLEAAEKKDEPFLETIPSRADLN